MSDEKRGSSLFRVGQILLWYYGVIGYFLVRRTVLEERPVQDTELF
jgi:hypothetical protein